MAKLPLAIGLVLLQAASFAAAQTTPPEPRPAQTQPADALGGPVIEPDDRDTLVVFEYGGELQDLGLPPAEAALELVDLDPQTAERVAKILTERAMLAEQLIIDNFELVSQGEAVETSGSKLEKGVFFLQVVQALKPLIDRGSLEDEIRAVLPQDTAERFDALLDEYWAAVGQSRVDQARAKGEKLRLRKAVREARRDQLGKEVELAAQRALESERFTIDYLTKGLELTASQRDRIRALITDFAGRTMGDPSQSEKERLFVEVIAYLNEQQRTLILERIKGL
jgi:hypothetical protein